jgi:hypothetical protein
MLPFGVTFPAIVPQGSEIPEGLMNNPVLSSSRIQRRVDLYRVTTFWEDLAASISRVAQKEFNVALYSIFFL